MTTQQRSAREVAMRQVPASGRVTRDGRGLEVIVSRQVNAPADEVWEWLTSSARTKQWFGSFRATPRVGKSFAVTMVAERGKPSVDLVVLECEPGQRYVVEQVDDGEGWHITVSIAPLGGSTMVFLSQRLPTARAAGDIGPGWEYYLDRLLAAQTGGEMPDFADYFPSQRPYYERLAMDGDPVAWPAS